MGQLSRLIVEEVVFCVCDREITNGDQALFQGYTVNYPLVCYRIYFTA